MDDAIRKKIDAIILERKRAHTFYNRNSPVYRAFTTMEQAAFGDGALPTAQKELIAIGISVHINCESCMEWHIKQALDAGASREQILEAIGVGIEMGGGPATVASRFAMHVLDYYAE